MNPMARNQNPLAKGGKGTSAGGGDEGGSHRRRDKELAAIEEAERKERLAKATKRYEYLYCAV